MSRAQILLVGAGGHARACIDVIELEDRFEIAGLTGVGAEQGTCRSGYDVIGTDDDLPKLRGQYACALVVVGQVKSADRRRHLYGRLRELGFGLPIIASPLAHVSAHAKIGEASIAMHGAIVNAGASVGVNCILNSRSLIEHDATIGDHCHISTGAIVNGGARVGEGSFVGSGSVIREGITIGRRCIVGMGASVRKDQPDDARVFGDA